jgi:methylmalonyl-CoA mutase N-terminal domain/subunit
MNSVVLFLLKQVVDLLLGSDVFDRVLATVERWSDKQISGIEKKQGVIAELEIIGLKLSESAANFAVEAAVQYLKAKV